MSSQSPPPLPKSDSLHGNARRGPPKWLIVLLVMIPILFLAVVVLAIKNFKVPTGSMGPNVPAGSRVITERVSLLFNEPKRGEIVVFSTEKIDKLIKAYGRKQFFIMRIAGLPGDELTVKDGQLYVNKNLFEVRSKDNDEIVAYVPNGNLREGAKLTVAESNFFVLGDDSAKSYDSRFWAFVPEESIKYRYWFTYYFDEKFAKQREGRLQKEKTAEF